MLRREFRRQQVELLELNAVGLGATKEARLSAIKTEMNCLKMMEEANLDISMHIMKPRNNPSSFKNETFEKMKISTAIPILYKSECVFTNPQA